MNIKTWFSNNRRTALTAVVFALLVGCLLLSCGAHAGTVTLTWSNATTRADGSPLPAAELANVKVYRAATAAGVASATTPIATVNAPGTTYTDPSAPAGTWFYAVSSVDSGGRESVKTAAVSAIVPVSPPNPPNGLTVTAVVAGLNMSPAYRINADGTRGTAVLGFVPAGTSCTGAPVYSYRGVTYARIDPARVTWWNTSPTTNVAAACRAS